MTTEQRKTSQTGFEHYDLEILLRRPSLRTNIPRRTSQVCREIITTKSTTCGIGCIQGKWLQSFANRNTYTFTYGILGCFYCSYYAYFYSTITTFERQSKLSSLTMSIIASLSDMTQMAVCLILSRLTMKNYRPKWIGFGIYIVVLSTIFSSLPYFYFGSEFLFKGTEKNKTLNTEVTLNVCSNKNQPCTAEKEANIIIIFLVISQILHGIGGSFYFILGAKYKNENVKNYQTPALLSLLLIFKTLGPALGYWLSSICLKIFSLPLFRSHAYEFNKNWLGAWWLGNLIIGFMLFTTASIIILFPTTLPKTAIKNTVPEDKEKSLHNRLLKDSMTTFKGVVLNPTFNCNNFAGIFHILGYIPYYIFLPKYATILYPISDSSANFILGTVTLLVSAVGILITISVITKYKPTGKTLTGWNIFVGILSIGCLITQIYLSCPVNDTQSKAIASQLTKNNSTTKQECNSVQLLLACNKFDETFTSTFHADCNTLVHINETKVHTDCNDVLVNTTSNKKLFERVCFADCHYNFLVFVIVIYTFAFINATGRSSNFLFQMKFIEKQNKLLTFSIGVTCLGALSFLAPPILFGYILDKHCILWDNNCLKTGNCWLYDNEKLRFTFNWISVVFVAVGIIFDLKVWYLLKKLKLFDENSDLFVDENEEH